MAKGKPGRPRKGDLSALDDFMEEQADRIFSSLWVTVPHGIPHVTPNERKLAEDRARRLSEALGEDVDNIETRK